MRAIADHREFGLHGALDRCDLRGSEELHGAEYGLLEGDRSPTMTFLVFAFLPRGKRCSAARNTP